MHGIDWKTYLIVRDAIDTPGIRITYDNGAMEIMSPSPEHERKKTTFARLLEIWAIERDVPLQGYGSTTFRRAAKERGLEPDECYCLCEELRDIPDLAIEIVETHGGLDKLPIYASLGVGELWFYESATLTIHVLDGNAYSVAPRSVLLPSLDLTVLVEHLELPNQHEAVRAFRDRLRAG